ncbi:hypothetical protein ACVTNV_000586 [Vibrio alginolyticus]
MMWIPLLTSEIADLTASEKFFLLGLMREYGTNEEIFGEVKELGRSFGVTDKVASSALNKLEKNGWMRRKVIPKEMKSIVKGRYSYCIHADIANQLSGPVCAVNSDMVLYVSNASNHIKDKNGRNIRSSLRMFLLTLLAHSTPYGEVNDLSYTRLKSLLGDLTKDKYRSQIRYLREAGIISAYIPGFNSNLMFGKMTGRYLINFFTSRIERI